MVSQLSPWGTSGHWCPGQEPQAEALVLNLEDFTSSSPGYLAMLRDIGHNQEMENCPYLSDKRPIITGLPLLA